MMELMPQNCCSSIRPIDTKRGFRTEPLRSSFGCIRLSAPVVFFTATFRRSNSLVMSVWLPSNPNPASVTIIPRQKRDLTNPVTSPSGTGAPPWPLPRGSWPAATMEFRASSTCSRREAPGKWPGSRPVRPTRSSRRWCTPAECPVLGRWPWKNPALLLCEVKHIHQSAQLKCQKDQIRNWNQMNESWKIWNNPFIIT